MAGAAAFLIAFGANDAIRAQDQPERFGQPKTEGTVSVENKDVPMREIVGRNVVTQQNETIGEIVAVTPTDIIVRTGGMASRTIGVEIAELKTRSSPTTVYVIDQRALSTAPEVTFDSSRRAWSPK